MSKGQNGSSPYLSKDAIFALDDLEYEEVHIPSWDTTIRVRELTAMERNNMGVNFAKDGVPPDFYPRIACKVIVDENGKRKFTDGDAERLGQKSWKAVELIVNTTLRLSGMTEEAAENAGKESVSQPADSPSA